MIKQCASVLVGVLLLAAIPVSALAYIDCRDTDRGCTLEQLVQLNSDAAGLGFATPERIAIMQELIVKLTAQIVQLQSRSSTNASSASCLDLNNSLIIGSTDATTNGEVSRLQRFLGEYLSAVQAASGNAGVPPEMFQPVTGYYGSKTAANVMRWQKAHGMDFVTLTSGVGPMTREKMKCGSTGAPMITKVEWRIEPANPSATESYQKDEQAIFVDVIRSDNSIRGYSVGKAYGCATSSSLPTVPGKKVLGFVHCYYALSGVAFTAYEANGKFIVERGDESAKDGSVIKTVVLEI